LIESGIGSLGRLLSSCVSCSEVSSFSYANVVQMAQDCRLEIQPCRVISSTAIMNMPWISSPSTQLSSMQALPPIFCEWSPSDISHSFLPSLSRGSSMPGLSHQVCASIHLIFLHTMSLTCTIGYTWSFAVQAIICTFGVIPTYIILQKFGPSWRKPMALGKAETNSIAESL
jgi:hypothetical protein